MHRLRIAIKQLRYTVELAQPDSPLDLEPAEKMAVKLQKQLGKLHDLDEALIRMERARGLEPHARHSVLAQLTRARQKLAARCDREIHGPLKKLLAEVNAALEA
jgi:CHAD domain-containing protein